MKFNPITRFLLLASLMILPAAAQEDMAYTSATTYDDGSQTWAYILWQATEPANLKGAVFAIYAKNGSAASTNPFTKLGETRLETLPSVLQDRLDRSVHLGQDLPLLEENIDDLFEGLVDGDSPLSLAEKISVALQGAELEDELYQQMLFLGRTHAALNLSLGLGWAEEITGVTTYEIRQINELNGADEIVLGRVTLDPFAGPVVLPAPGDMYQVQEYTGKGHLNARLRWATPNNLRRLSPLQHGYNVYRMNLAFAQSYGYDTAPPTPSTLHSLLLTNPNEVTRANGAPALAGVDYDNGSVTDSGDDTTFFVDDNKRFHGGDPFEACSEFVYFVTARDILGRDGSLSPPLQVTICDRLPPTAPMDVQVVNDYAYTGGSGDQRLKVIWSQNDETVDRKRAAAYYVYRWDTPQEYMSHEHDPLYNLIAGPINHIPGEAELSFRDDGGGAPAMPADANRTFWYTVRAVDEGDCGSCAANYSGNSAPAYGVLRDREGPAGPTGTIDIYCGDVDVRFSEARDVPYEQLGLPLDDTKQGSFPDLRGLVQAVDDCESNAVHITQSPAPFTPTAPGQYEVTLTATDPSGNKATCQTTVTVEAGRGNEVIYIFKARRTDLGIAWAEFFIDGIDPPQRIARVNFPRGAEEVTYTYRVETSAVGNFTLYCRMGSNLGNTSAFKSHSISALPKPNHALCIAFDGSTVVTQESSEDCGPHITVDPITGDTNHITGTITTTPTTRQWKLYRRVDEGDLTLLAVGEATHPATINWVDDTMPINPTRICYFAQLFDEHGNASPMVRLGCTRITGSGGLAVPMLTELEALGDASDPSMNIRWFGEQDSVERFEVWIAVDPGTLPDPFTENLSANTATSPNLVTVQQPGGAVDKDFAVFTTPRVGGPKFSGAPIYEIAVPIELGTTYTVFIKAMNANNGTSEASNVLTFNWTEPITPSGPGQPDVPWPARPEPGVTRAGFERTLARQLWLNDGFSGVGIRIGELNIWGYNCLAGNSEENPYFVPGWFPPNWRTYRSTLDNSSIFPFMIYRYQVPNAKFPTVSDDVVQVSPLQEEIAFRYGVSSQFGTFGSIIEDPFFAVLPEGDPFVSSPCGGAIPDYRGNYDYSDCTGGNIVVTQYPEPGTLVGPGIHQITITATDQNGNSTTITTTHRVDPPPNNGPVPYEIFALDTQGVIAGARYRYLLAHFGEDGEVEQVIPIDEIEVRNAQ